MARLIPTQIFEVRRLPKVATFLESIGRNSKSSETTYSFGILHLHNFISKKFPEYNCETILEPLLKNTLNVYELLEGYVSYLLETKPFVNKTVWLYVNAIRSYFAYHDIDVIPSKFKRKLKMPRIQHEDEEPLDATDIRKILLSCNNRRLKTFLLVLGSSGMRVGEVLAMRYMDTDCSGSPTKVHVRKEFSKTKVSRDVYISEEATHYLKQWFDWKYKNPDRKRGVRQNDLIFTVYQSSKPRSLYIKIRYEFERLLKIVEMDEKKEGGIVKRGKITLHSFRRFVKTVISNQVGQDYSEWFLGHSKSPYWTMKESERREIYATRIVKYLTFLDYSCLEVTGKNVEARLAEKEKEIAFLKERDSNNTDAIACISDQLTMVLNRLQVLEKKEEVITS